MYHTGPVMDKVYHHIGPVITDKTSTESSQSIEIVVDRNQQQVVNYQGSKGII